MILNDNWIRSKGSDMIDPFVPEQVKTDDSGNRVVSYGTSSYGYDIRLGKGALMTRYADVVDDGFGDTEAVAHVVDVHERECTEAAYTDLYPVERNGRTAYMIPPHSFVLAVSVERITVPGDVLVICQSKSTYARTGLVINVTPLEPGWSGYITLELSNTTDAYIPVYEGEGIAQLLFLQGNEPCATSYKDRGGKYQNQPARPVLPRV